MKRPDFESMARYEAGDVKERVTCADVLALHGITYGGGEIPCPLGTHQDRKPSFGLYDKNRKFKCHSCDETGDCIELEMQLSGTDFGTALRRLAERAGIKPQPIVRIRKDGTPEAIEATHDYHSLDSELVGQVVRYIPKAFRQRRPDPDNPGGWVWEKFPPILYRLPELMRAIASGKTVAVAEGERDVDELHKVGITATCNPGGAGKWDESFCEYLRGAKVVVFPDRDEAGAKHAAQVIRSLDGIAKWVKCFHLQHDGKSCNDPAEWVQAGGTPADHATDYEHFDPVQVVDSKENSLASIKKGVFFIANNRGVGCYYMQKPDGRFLPLNERGISRHLQRAGMNPDKPKDGGESEIGNFLLDAQLNSALDYAGNLAGFNAGVHELNGIRFLSMRSPVTPEAVPGPSETLQAVLNGLFPDDDNRRRFEAWFFHAWEYLHRREWAPLPVLALAGPRNCGKSLLVNLLAHVLGGTEPGQALRYISGETSFNADLAGAHLLVVDDEISSTDMRTRRATMQRIKALAVLNHHRIEPKGYDAVTLAPHWRAVFATNDEPEALQVLPPIEDGLRDKLLLLRCQRTEMPMPSASPKERAAFMDQLKADVPGFLDHLRRVDWLKSFRDSRQAVTGWQDGILRESLESLNAERQLLDLIDVLKPWDRIGGTWTGTAAELESLLLDGHSPTARKADKVLNWSNATGTYLGRLTHSHPDRVRRAEPERERKWEIRSP